MYWSQVQGSVVVITQSPKQDYQNGVWKMWGDAHRPGIGVVRDRSAYHLCRNSILQIGISFQDFQVLIHDEAVLALARMYRWDVLVLNDEVDLMSGNRHAACRQFIQDGRFRSGQRHVIPSCCFWQIHDKYLDGQYTGFISSRLA